MAQNDDIEKYKKFLYEVLRPDYLKTVKQEEEMIQEKHEYEILLVSVTKIIESEAQSLMTRMNLGHHVFANAEIEDCSKVIVKMTGDMFAELPLDRAVGFIEKKIEILGQRAERIQETASKIRAHMDYVLSSIASYEKLL
ncbi:unnamed protein product [Auanema sp. JU1783]|nr:unnamed protein product [Auanema sp. JU1783]